MSYFKFTTEGFIQVQSQAADGWGKMTADEEAAYKSIQPGQRMKEGTDGRPVVMDITPTAAEIAATRIAEITIRLSEIDMESIRALRAQKIGRGSQPDIDKLNALENEAEALHIELAGIV
jgi:hypothetical protein